MYRIHTSCFIFIVSFVAWITISRSASFSSFNMPPPTGPLKRVYNAQERAVINPFKEDFLNAATPAARKAIAQVHMFPALFNYWDSIGITINDDEMEARSNVSGTYII